MIVDSLARAAAVASVPAVALAATVPVWQLYVVAGVYGLLKMIPLAGVPALVPDLVPADRYQAANALESISYFLSSVAGTFLAGGLVAAIGGAAALWLDAASYVAFAVTLVLIGPVAAEDVRAAAPRLRDALRFLMRTRIVLATTAMFMCVNVGSGVIIVALPVYVRTVLHGGATAYGAVLGCLAAAGLVGAVVGGSRSFGALGRAIAAAEVAAGAAYALLVARPSVLLLAAAALLLGPLTVWAQTIRMRLIPPELRGRVFALLRTLMQATPPLGAAVGAFVLGAGGLRLAWAAAAVALIVPAVVALAAGALEEVNAVPLVATGSSWGRPPKTD
jgi:MFS family permease